MKRAITLVFIMTLMLSAKDYTNNPKTIEFMDKLVQKYNFKRTHLEKLFSDVKVQKSALRAFRPKVKKNRTPEQIAALKKRYPKYGAWDRYAKHKVSDSRVKEGVEFIKRHRTIFEKVEKKYTVPKEYIAAIIGIETAYGRNVGKYQIFDTLTTLAFEKNRRNKFFQKELMKFILLSKTEKFNPKNVYGSYAGAIGLGQFMPSNYEAYGVDFNGDGRITLQKPEDAIASVANYMKQNGWRKGEPVATRVGYEGMRFKAYETGYRKTYDRAQLKGIRPKEKWDYSGKVRLIKLNKEKYDELWYGAKNFFVITRYNHSAYYAMSVHQLATKIAARMKEK
ncbi:MAG: lytic murein transglycosylase B [Sulfurovum sp.]|nr:lytic murein transglycosylase B [Sulfurovum sp.]NNJ46022.1 lytic murein transglycosylase B [Sulfurovum sp.]